MKNTPWGDGMAAAGRLVAAPLEGIVAGDEGIDAATATVAAKTKGCIGTP